jgi:hypothetical protein
LKKIFFCGVCDILSLRNIHFVNLSPSSSFSFAELALFSLYFPFITVTSSIAIVTLNFTKVTSNFTKVTSSIATVTYSVATVTSSIATVTSSISTVTSGQVPIGHN